MIISGVYSQQITNVPAMCMVSMSGDTAPSFGLLPAQVSGRTAFLEGISPPSSGTVQYAAISDLMHPQPMIPGERIVEIYRPSERPAETSIDLAVVGDAVPAVIASFGSDDDVHIQAQAPLGTPIVGSILSIVPTSIPSTIALGIDGDTGSVELYIDGIPQNLVSQRPVYSGMYSTAPFLHIAQTFSVMSTAVGPVNTESVLSVSANTMVSQYPEGKLDWCGFNIPVPSYLLPKYYPSTTADGRESGIYLLDQNKELVSFDDFSDSPFTEIVYPGTGSKFIATQWIDTSFTSTEVYEIVGRDINRITSTSTAFMARIDSNNNLLYSLTPNGIYSTDLHSALEGTISWLEVKLMDFNTAYEFTLAPSGSYSAFACSASTGLPEAYIFNNDDFNTPILEDLGGPYYACDVNNSYAIFGRQANNSHVKAFSTEGVEIPVDSTGYSVSYNCIDLKIISDTVFVAVIRHGSDFSDNDLVKFEWDGSKFAKIATLQLPPRESSDTKGLRLFTLPEDEDNIYVSGNISAIKVVNIENFEFIDDFLPPEDPRIVYGNVVKLLPTPPEPTGVQFDPNKTQATLTISEDGKTVTGSAPYSAEFDIGKQALSTLPKTRGRWQFEAEVVSLSATTNQYLVGVSGLSAPNLDKHPGMSGTDNAPSTAARPGLFFINKSGPTSTVSSAPIYGVGDVVTVGLDLDVSPPAIVWYWNGVQNVPPTTFRTIADAPEWRIAVGFGEGFSTPEISIRIRGSGLTYPIAGYEDWDTPE